MECDMEVEGEEVKSTAVICESEFQAGTYPWLVERFKVGFDSLTMNTVLSSSLRYNINMRPFIE